MADDFIFKISAEANGVERRMEAIGIRTPANYLYNTMLLMDIASRRTLQDKGDPRLSLIQNLRPVSVECLQLGQLEQLVLQLKSTNDRPGKIELVEQLTGTRG